MSIEERGKALEEAFFAKRNKELLQQLKQDLDQGARHQELKSAVGIQDDALLDRLMDLGIQAESLAAMSLAPTVMMAWVDGNVDDKERAAIMSGARACGIEPDSTAGKLLQYWLEEEPDESFKQLWIDYTRAVCAKLQAGDQVNLRMKVMDRCRQVAEAAGGFLGLGSISKPEHDLLEDLKAAFD